MRHLAFGVILFLSLPRIKETAEEIRQTKEKTEEEETEREREIDYRRVNLRSLVCLQM